MNVLSILLGFGPYTFHFANLQVFYHHQQICLAITQKMCAVILFVAEEGSGHYHYVLIQLN